jgi:hypothetical protein
MLTDKYAVASSRAKQPKSCLEPAIFEIRSRQMRKQIMPLTNR